MTHGGSLRGAAAMLRNWFSTCRSARAMLAVACAAMTLAAALGPAGCETAAARPRSVTGTTTPAVTAGAWWSAPPAAPAPGNASAANPSLDSVLGDGAGNEWDVTGSFVLERDKQLGRDIISVPAGKVIGLDGRTRVPAERELRALVRFRTSVAPTGYITLTLARREIKVPDAKDPKTLVSKECHFRVALSGSESNGTISATITQDGFPLHDLKAAAAKTQWSPQLSNAFSYQVREFSRYLPGWPEDFRARVEHDMASIPAINDKWIEIRAELRNGQFSVWMDDRLMATKQDPAIKPEGTMRIDLSAGTQLGAWVIRPVAPPTPGFTTIPLAGAANARAFLGSALKTGSLPPPNAPVLVGGVPFVFPGVNLEGNDHIDVARSFLRQCNTAGYLPTAYSDLARWNGTASRDPARIQVRIPDGTFDTLYAIAAADDRAEHVPLLTAMFYRPGAGFVESFAGNVPLASATSTDATPLPVTFENGRKTNLWLVKIPLDPGRLSSFADMDIVEIEFTKEIAQYRTYPDPISYGWHQAGRPSSVHLFAATLGHVPVNFAWEPDLFGHVWQSPANPAYTATLNNNTDQPQAGKLTVTTRSYDGTEKTKQEKAVTLPKGAVNVKVSVPAPVNLFGYHDITATLEIAGKTWTEKRSMVKLAPDTRSVKWTPGRGTLFGYWSYGGGHHTANLEHHVRLMTWAGARTSIGYPKDVPSEVKALVDKHWSPTQAGAWEVDPQAWAINEPFDPAKVEAFQNDIIKKFHAYRDPIPEDRRPDHVYFYPEPHISSRLSAGNIPDYWQGEPYQLTEDEKMRIKMFFNTSKLAAQAVRKEFPNLKVLIPWGDPGFSWPLLRAGFPKELIDGSGIDIPGFERWPERQLHEQSIHRLYMTKKEFEKAGIPKPQLQYCEGIFVPTEVGAVTWREQMDIYTRWTLISMGYGFDRFYSGWFAFDCTNYYGAEHYGGCGIQRKIPYCDPKPAYASYATMTDKLNEANFDGWEKTGSLTTYVMRFKKSDEKGFVYPVWTLAGKRPITLTLDADDNVSVTDSMNNTKVIASKEKKITVTTDPSVIYVTFANAKNKIVSAQVGEPDHGDAKPAATSVQVADLGDGSWTLTNRKDTILETNHWGIMHYPGKFSTRVIDDTMQGKVLESKLEKQDVVHELMPWYNVLKPSKPIVLGGVPSKLGLWVKGNSDWGRFIYILRDAKGERWTSIGAKDDYNCDDVHSWSQYLFDGWRYLPFELPGHTGWDSFRKHGTTWWRSDNGDGVVDLPLTVEEIIIEQRSHILYVNDVQPVAGDTVAYGKLFVEYDKASDNTAEAVRVTKLRAPLPTGLPELPNPIADLATSGVGAPTKIVRLRPPEHHYDGTRTHVDFEEVPGAKAHHVWVSAHADGRGAVNMVPGGIKNGQLIYGLRPAVKLYYWITYTDKDGKTSKPSPAHAETLVDNFKEK